MVVDKILINNIRDFDSLREMWFKIEKGKDMTVYQSFSWNKLLVQEHFKTFLPDFFTTIVIYMVKNNNNVCVILPLIVQRKGNKTKWFGRKKGVYILGHASYSDYLNAVYKDADVRAFEELFIRLKKDLGIYTFNFTDMIEGTGFEKFIESRGIPQQESTVSVAVNKRDSGDEYNKSLSKHVRQNLRTALNRMNKDGIRYDCKVIWGKVDNLNLLDELRNLHIERMSEKNNVNTDVVHKLSSAVRIYYQKNKELSNNVVYEGMRTLDNSVFVLVYLNDKIAGYLYGLQEQDTIRILQNCFRSEYKFYSPMFRGIYDFLVECFNNNIVRQVDFTRGNETYKYQLAGVETKLKQYRGIL